MDNDAIMIASLNSFSDSSVGIRVIFCSKLKEFSSFMSLKHEVMLSVYSIIKEEGADLAYPVRKIVVEE